MKLKLILISIGLVVLSIAPMIIMGKIDPMAYFDSGIDKGVSSFNKLKASAPKNLSSVMSKDKIKIYRWRDKNGVMQFSNVPPPTDRKVERVDVDPNSNLMQAVKVPIKEVAVVSSKKGKPAKMESPYSVKGAKKILEEARGIKGQLKRRQEQQQQAFKQL